MLKKSLLPPFLAIKSEENKVLSILISAGIALWVAATFCVLLGAVYVLFKDANTPVALKIVLLLIGLLMNGIWIYLWKRSALTRYTNVTINEQGVFYYNRYTDKPVREVRWQDFRTSPDPAELHDTINKVEPLKSSPYLLWWEAGAEGKTVGRQETFRMGHFYPAVFKNRGELIAGLLLGLAHFRPELTIDKNIFSAFYIDEQEYVFKKAEQVKTYILVIVFCVIVFLLMCLWANRQ